MQRRAGEGARDDPGQQRRLDQQGDCGAYPEQAVGDQQRTGGSGAAQQARVQGAHGNGSSVAGVAGTGRGAGGAGVVRGEGGER